MLYSNDSELKFNSEYTIKSALCVSIKLANDYESIFRQLWDCVKAFIGKKVISGDHTAVSEIAESLENTCGVKKYKARAICEVIIASMDSYRKNYARTTTPIAIEKTTTAGTTKYQFNVAVNSYFSWVEKNFKKILSEITDEELYLINDNGNSTKEIAVILGILEALDVLSFKMIGGANSQLYIYINQIQGLKNILNGNRGRGQYH